MSLYCTFLHSEPDRQWMSVTHNWHSAQAHKTGSGSIYPHLMENRRESLPQNTCPTDEVYQFCSKRHIPYCFISKSDGGFLVLRVHSLIFGSSYLQRFICV